jgi:hypothetical protein
MSDADLDAIVGGKGIVETVVNVVKAILNPDNWTCTSKSCVFETGPTWSRRTAHEKAGDHHRPFLFGRPANSARHGRPALAFIRAGNPAPGRPGWPGPANAGSARHRA